MKGARLVSGTGRHVSRMGQTVAFAEGLYEIARDTYAWMVPNGDWGETNLGLIRCANRSVLVDTCWDLEYTQEMLAHARTVLDPAPISQVINTHADGDHCWGNQLFADLPVVATEATLKQFRHHTPRRLWALQAASTALSHVPALHIDAMGRYMGNMLRPYRFSGIRLSPPNQTFVGVKQLTVGDTAIDLRQVGPAHTDGDLWVHVPERGVVFSGDILFVGITPVAWAGPLENLIGALQSLLALQADVVVPGHGPLADAADIRLQIEYWQWVNDIGGDLARSGCTPREATERCLRSERFRSSPFARWSAPERLYTSMCTHYRALGVLFKALPGPLGALDHFRKQAACAKALMGSSH